MKRNYLIIMTICVLSFINFNKGTAQNNNNIPIEFNKLVHDFGDIQLSSGKHSYTFTFKNISKETIVIQTVVSSCGCTTPVWTKNPIKPGAPGKVAVTFLNDQGPYPFDKSLTVYVSNSPRPVILRIKGIVHQKPKNVKQLFPESFGALGLRTSVLNVGQIAQGSSKVDVIEVANISNKKITVGFSDLSNGLSISVSPTVIAPGKKAELKIVVDTKNAKNWGVTKFLASVVVNGVTYAAKRIVVEANIRDNFSNLTNEQLENAPLPMADKSTFDFGNISSGVAIENTFEIKNLGRRDLLIHKIDYNEPGIEAKFQSSIKPGATGKISVKINTNRQNGEKTYILTLVTNSPSRPVLNLIVSGSIEK